MQIPVFVARCTSLYSEGAYENGEKVCRRLLRRAGDEPVAWMFLAIFLLAQGRFAEAEKAGDQATRLAPGAPEAWANRAVARIRLAKLDLALQDIDRALHLRPSYPEARSNRANILHEQGAYGEALSELDAALVEKPAFPEAWSQKALTLLEFGRFGEAENACRQALALSPTFVDALSNLGVVFQAQGRYLDAIEPLNQAIALDPSHAAARHNLGLCLHGLRKYREAVVELSEAFRIAPGLKGLLGQLIYSKAHICDWSDYERLLPRLIEAVGEGRAACTPMQLLGVVDSPALSLACARRALRGPAFAPAPINRGETVRPDGGASALRVAFVSGDFRQHPCAVMLVELIEKLDRTKVHAIGVNLGPQDDSLIGLRARNAFPEFVDVSKLDDRAAIDTVRGLDVDVAVDLMGHTLFGRPALFVARLAPVQMGFLGYPGTVGGGNDYIVVDGVVAGDDGGVHFSEKLCRLPHCYLPTNPALNVGAPPSRASLGLPEDKFVFASFNGAWKITPEVFDIWMAICREAPGSVLWIANANPDAQRNLLERASFGGVDPSRLLFAPREEDDARHLGRQSVADILLDTYPYNAHTTACDALLAGLPVLTVRGGTFCARVGSSILQVLGVPELIAHDLQDYKERALGFYREPGRLAAVKQSIRRNVASSPLFDMDLYARHFEDALEHVARRSRNGLAPASFDVPRQARTSKEATT